MGVRRIEVLEAAGDFLLPIRFGICINSRIQAVSKEPAIAARTSGGSFKAASNNFVASDPIREF